MQEYANDPVVVEFEGHPGRRYQVRQDKRGFYVTRTDRGRDVFVVAPDHMGPNESCDTEAAAYWYAQGCADGDRRA